jgi:hypothetical protein
MHRTLILAAALAALSACASGAPDTASAGGWTFAYDSASGVASATQRDPDGSTSASVSCQAPSGDMMLVDNQLGERVRGSTQAQFRIGQQTITVPAQSDGRRLTVRLPRRPPNLGAYAHLSQDTVSLTAGGRTHAYAADAVQKIAQVANACWPSGS